MVSFLEIQEQIKALQQQADVLKKTELDSVIAEVKSKVQQYGLTAKDLGFATAAKKGSRGAVAPKYAKGEDTWTGRGRQPKWVADHVAAGGKLEDLLIK
jgi:DNA-binding protein H-NS